MDGQRPGEGKEEVEMSLGRCKAPERRCALLFNSLAHVYMPGTPEGEILQGRDYRWSCVHMDIHYCGVSGK